MATFNPVDILAVIEAQRNWLYKLQEADPTHAIKIKVIEGESLKEQTLIYIIGRILKSFWTK